MKEDILNIEFSVKGGNRQQGDTRGGTAEWPRQGLYKDEEQRNKPFLP